MLEKIIRENDTYFLEILENRIIINDNYHGILIFDFGMNFIKAINIFEDIVVYDSYVISNEELILFCPENEKLVYVNCETSTSKVIDIDEELSHIVDLRLFSMKDNTCIFVSAQNKYIELNLQNKTLKEVSNTTFKSNKENIINKAIEDKIGEIIDKDEDYIDIDVKEKLFVISYEEEIVFYNGEVIKEILPEEEFIFRKAKIRRCGDKNKLIILSNNIEDEEISTISILNI